MPHIEHDHLVAFATERVNLPSAKAAEHRSQVNGLRDRLAKKIDADSGYGLVKSLHAGSVAKRTALKSVNDLDLAVYIKADQAPQGDTKLVPWLADRLFEATTNMERSQFEENPHCVTVHYRGSGLDVDVVPVLYKGEPNSIGYLVNKDTGDRLKTSTRQHLDFMAERRRKKGPEFLELIRLTKQWKRVVTARRGESFKCKSFMIELIWAHLVDEGLDVSDYTKALEAFYRYFVVTNLENQIAFTDFMAAKDIPARGDAPIEVLDPVNPVNNVAVRYTASDRDLLVGEAGSAFDALTDARFATTKQRALEGWRSVLGDGFGG